MKVKITRPCKLYLTKDQEKPYTMGDTFEIESLDGIESLVEVIEEEEKPKRKTRKKRSASKEEADPLDSDASNDDAEEVK